MRPHCTGPPTPRHETSLYRTPYSQTWDLTVQDPLLPDMRPHCTGPPTPDMRPHCTGPPTPRHETSLYRTPYSQTWDLTVQDPLLQTWDLTVQDPLLPDMRPHCTGPPTPRHETSLYRTPYSQTWDLTVQDPLLPDMRPHCTGPPTPRHETSLYRTPYSRHETSLYRTPYSQTWDLTVQDPLLQTWDLTVQDPLLQTWDLTVQDPLLQTWDLTVQDPLLQTWDLTVQDPLLQTWDLTVQDPLLPDIGLHFTGSSISTSVTVRRKLYTSHSDIFLFKFWSAQSKINFASKIGCLWFSNINLFRYATDHTWIQRKVLGICYPHPPPTHPIQILPFSCSFRRIFCQTNGSVPPTSLPVWKILVLPLVKACFRFLLMFPYAQLLVISWMSGPRKIEEIFWDFYNNKVANHLICLSISEGIFSVMCVCHNILKSCKTDENPIFSGIAVPWLVDKNYPSWSLFLYKKCIAVGCVPSAAVAVWRGACLPRGLSRGYLSMGCVHSSPLWAECQILVEILPFLQRFLWVVKIDSNEIITYRGGSRISQTWGRAPNPWVYCKSLLLDKINSAFYC